MGLSSINIWVLGGAIRGSQIRDVYINTWEYINMEWGGEGGGGDSRIAYDIKSTCEVGGRVASWIQAEMSAGLAVKETRKQQL